MAKFFRLHEEPVELTEGNVLPVRQLHVPMPKVAPLRQAAPPPEKDKRG